MKNEGQIISFGSETKTILDLQEELFKSKRETLTALFDLKKSEENMQSSRLQWVKAIKDIHDENSYTLEQSFQLLHKMEHKMETLQTEKILLEKQIQGLKLENKTLLLEKEDNKEYIIQKNEIIESLQKLLLNQTQNSLNIKSNETSTGVKQQNIPNGTISEQICSLLSKIFPDMKITNVNNSAELISDLVLFFKNKNKSYITLNEFKSGNNVFIFHNSNSIYEISNNNENIKYFLDPDCISENWKIKKKECFIGRIIYISDEMTSRNDQFKITYGTKYYLVAATELETQ